MITIRIVFPSGYAVALPPGSPLPRVGDGYTVTERGPERRDGSTWRTTVKVRRGVVARVAWSTDLVGDEERTFVTVHLRRVPKPPARQEPG